MPSCCTIAILQGKQMRQFNAIDIGATLYVPATFKTISAIASGIKYPELRSVVFCLEDAIREDELEFAMRNISNMIKEYEVSHVKVFIRPRDEYNLSKLLDLEGIDKIDGFALAKFNTKNMKRYIEVLQMSYIHFYLMPVIESSDMFDIDALKSIREFLQSIKKDRVLTLRMGGEDMFRMLGLKRDCQSSIHDFHVSSRVIADMLSVFKPYGFNVTSAVYSCFKEDQFFANELKRDIKEGLFGKTIIHPSQIEISNEVYKVSQEELDEARAISQKDDAIFRYGDKMIEKSVHQSYANIILQRYEIYGVRS
jgi:citrate lyase beta subunit